MVTEVIEPGYRKTEIGVIPKDWDLISFDDAFDFLSTASYSRSQLSDDQDILYVHYGDIHTKWNHFLDFLKESLPSIDNAKLKSYSLIKEGDLIMADASEDYEGICKSVEVRNIGSRKAISGLHTFLLRSKKDVFVNGFKGYINSNGFIKTQFDRLATGLKVYGVSKTNLKVVLIPHPKEEEQKAIFKVLSDTDNLIDSLNKLIRKKSNMKIGVMQELITGKRRLQGFNRKWTINSLENISICLDNLRIPLNESQRNKMKGDIPYCGANGVLDFVNNYVIDDDIILLAEDGGYFEEFKTRPIAYRMIGKCWVNNHAHIIKAKNNIDQGFLFYSLVHKNIISYITSGTRSKLNRSELNKVEINMPEDKKEQLVIAQVLSDMDTEIENLEQQRDKYKMLKEGMMQQLLTGNIRLK